ncbi:MAG: cell division protein ZapA [Clostridium sp.]|nr:cell division protein ZapA [Clostridium sp.]
MSDREKDAPNDKIELTLRVAGHAIQMNVSPDQVETLESAAMEVNHAWDTFRKRFDGRPKDEILAMVTMLFAQAFVSLREENLRTEAVLARFEQRLDSILDAEEE